ncbi:M16 family metallopeptidase [Mucilaginibacter sp. SP1R1]|uniref:M16 family metallopeptidase n=1 Tax=Mucilaginibacter sp. SP1R1 TaxID=2723091 RepID=UPI00161FB411|nr:pitrilysin family protein [Mucilaginibacter sp. SP1R1]MBB6151058.1 putative Zn-dependent peptidase [Mucilaginibacter sp. SP1R1]
MKKIFITILFVCFGLPGVFAQSETTSFDVDGIKVIFKPTLKEIINVRMFYRGGVTNYPADKAGIERFALEATTECGTKKYDANMFRDKADKFGIDISTSTDFDYGNIEMDCVSKYFNEGWDLLTEAVVNPVFDNAEVELFRGKMLARIRQQQTDPDDHVEDLVVKNGFEGTPYATDPAGEDAIVSKLTPAELKTYYNSILNKKQLFLVVAGKINKEELIAKIKASFAALPSKNYTPAKLQEPVWNDYRLVTESRNLSTNYINAIMNSPTVSSKDYVPYTVGIAALGGSLFNLLRTRLNLSYDPGASSLMRQMPYSIMYVSTTNPKEAVKAMTRVLNNVLNYGLSAEGLKNIKSSYITNNYVKQQSTSAITLSLGKAEVLGGWEIAENMPSAIDKVTVSQINAALNKYIRGLRWSYLGDTQQADAAAGEFKKIIH